MTNGFLFAAALGLTSAIVTRGVVLIVNIFMANRLTVNDFGSFSFAYVTAISLGSFIAAAIGQSAGAQIPGVIAESPERQAPLVKAYVRVTVVLLVGMFMILFLTPQYLSSMHAEKHLALGCGLALIAGGMSQSSQGILYSLGRHPVAAVAGVLGSFIILGSLILVPGVTGEHGLYILALGGTLTALINLASIRSSATAGLVANVKAEMRQVWRSLLPFLLTTGLGAPVHWLCISIIKASKEGNHEVAMFVAAFQLYTVITFIPGVIANIAIPYMSNRQIDRDRRSSSDLIFRQALKIILAISVVLGVVLTILSDYLLEVLYPPEFQAASSTMKVLAIAAVVASVSALLQQRINSFGRFYSNLKLALLYAAVYLGCALLLSSLGLGGFGLAVSILIAFSVHAVLQFLAVHRCGRLAEFAMGAHATTVASDLGRPRPLKP